MRFPVKCNITFNRQLSLSTDGGELILTCGFLLICFVFEMVRYKELLICFISICLGHLGVPSNVNTLNRKMKVKM